MNADFEKIVSDTQKRSATLQRIGEILNSGEFYLTGSRFFGNFNPNSDFDYFISSDEFHHENELKELGFGEIRNSYMNDLATEKVLRFGGIIDIQITKPEFLEAKLKARDKINLAFHSTPMVFQNKSKTFWSNLWSVMIQENLK